MLYLCWSHHTYLMNYVANVRLLSKGKKEAAIETLQRYVKIHPQLSGSRASLPLINFLHYIIRAIET